MLYPWRQCKADSLFATKPDSSICSPHRMEKCFTSVARLAYNPTPSSCSSFTCTQGWSVQPGIGGIAQLGERLHGMQEVSGSIPLTSTFPNSRNFN